MNTSASTSTRVHSFFRWSSNFPELPPDVVSVCFCTRPQRTWCTVIKACASVGPALGPAHCIMLVNACLMRKVEELVCSPTLEKIRFAWWLDANVRNQGSSKTGMNFAKVYTLLVFIKCCCWNFEQPLWKLGGQQGKAARIIIFWRMP